MKCDFSIPVDARDESAWRGVHGFGAMSLISKLPLSSSGPASGAEIGCRDGNRYFEGIRGFLEIPKVQQMGFP